MQHTDPNPDPNPIPARTPTPPGTPPGSPLDAASHAPELVARLRAAGCVFAEDEARLLCRTARGADELADMAARRIAGEPLEHVLGWAAFAGLRIAVGPGVFVPRPRTEFLVRRAAACVPEGAAPLVVDLCCGSGAVGAALLAACGGRGELHAVDIDPAAVRCARRNLAGPGRHVHEGDLFAPLPTRLRGRVEVLTANVPYVPTGDLPLLPPEARDHEPRPALDGGPDGLALLRRVAAQAPEWLAPGGTLLTETSSAQAPEAARVLAGAGLEVTVTTEEEPPATVLAARRP
ncbi:putative protein N(5)-glutamine methyltransferase [Streptomyces albus subsp. chlorinus]|uniref:putative protein N(5)-glutamine methyltransferase n=1 Tax=Streptomyces albus TaxID=1888 RepID=UPI00156E7987|nr:putative protein N(5)-glutamine methyltransferase [Streptomyces albus]NSC21342.1 putative protein N(5)-glutamine methyltransferase [Streptomyces albus subsp. chlorinus]